MQKPVFVTFTGIDRWTDVGRLTEMSSRWPIEWGVLASRDRSGVDPRYLALSSYADLARHPLRLAVHLCGSWARQAVSGDPLDVTFVDAAQDVFGRVQVNVADGEEKMRDDDVASALLATVTSLGAGRPILQCRGTHFPTQTRVDWLFDRSAGTGETPSFWARARPASDLVGYAGGIGPDEVRSTLDLVGAVHPETTPYWIDMESRVRTDDRLDLDKCEAVLRVVYGDGGR